MTKVSFQTSQQIFTVLQNKLVRILSKNGDLIVQYCDYQTLKAIVDGDSPPETDYIQKVNIVELDGHRLIKIEQPNPRDLYLITRKRMTKKQDEIKVYRDNGEHISDVAVFKIPKK